MYLPVPPRRGCGRYRKGTHGPPSPRSRSPTSSGRAPPGSGAGYAGLRLPPVAAPRPVDTASPAPLFLPPSPSYPGPAPPFFSPGPVQAPSSLPARLLSLPRPPGSAPVPGGAGLQLPRRSHHHCRRVLRCAARSPPPPPPARPRYRPGGSPGAVHTRSLSPPRETRWITGKSLWA